MLALYREMKRTRWAGLCAVLCGIVLSLRGAHAAEPYVLRTVSDKITGLVLYSDGKTPVKNAQIRVWDVQKDEYIHKTRTDEFGAYELPKLELGEYRVSFDQVQLELQIVEQSHATVQYPHNIIVIIPRALVFPNVLPLQAFILPTGMILGDRAIQDPDKEPRVILIPPPPESPPDEPPTVVSP
jgi:hypothetical protein